MTEPRQVHRGATRVMSAVIAGLGVAIVVSTVVRGGGPAAVGVLVGALFIAAGAGRLYLSRDTDA